MFNLEGVRREIEGDIAQLGERLPCKQEVAGSNPTISTKRIKRHLVQDEDPELSWLERTTDNRKVGGSSPLGPTRRFAFGFEDLIERSDLQI